MYVDKGLVHTIIGQWKLGILPEIPVLTVVRQYMIPACCVCMLGFPGNSDVPVCRRVLPASGTGRSMHDVVIILPRLSVSIVYIAPH